MKPLESVTELRRLKKELAARPKADVVIRVCSTGCRALGALEVCEALEKQVVDHHLEDRVRVVRTGCHGLCAAAVALVVDPTGIFYQNVQPEDAAEIIEQTVLARKVIKRLCVTSGKRRFSRQRDIPFYKHQTRRVLRNCGVVDPRSLEDAIAHGAYTTAARALSTLSPEQVIEEDNVINEKRYEIEETCIRLIATQQPMASDLRIIVSAIHLATDLERMGDYASGIAEITLLIRGDQRLQPLIDIPRMSDIGIDMLNESLKAFIDKDASKAREIARRDDEVDSLYHKVLSKCITAMVDDPKNVPVATRIIWVAHKLERISDRVTNICERVVFTVTGKMEELDSG